MRKLYKFPMWITRLLILIIVNFYCMNAQEKGADQQIKELESRMAIIEDYLKNRLNQLMDQVESRNALLSKIQKENLEMQKDITDLQNRLKNAESEIIRMKVEISILKKGDFSATSVQSEKTKEVGEIKTPSEDASLYQDPEIKRLVSMMSSPDSSMRIGAVLQLSVKPNTESTKALIYALRDQDIYVKMLVCKALAKRKARDAIDPMIELLSSENKELSSVVHQSLQKITGIEFSFDEAGGKKLVEMWKEKLKTRE